MAQQVKINANVTDLLNKGKDLSAAANKALEAAKMNGMAAAANTAAPVVKLEKPNIALKTIAVPNTATKSVVSPSIGSLPLGSLKKDNSTGDGYKTLDEINDEIEEPEVVAKPAVIDDGSKTKKIIIIVAVVIAVVAVVLAVARKRK